MECAWPPPATDWPSRSRCLHFCNARSSEAIMSEPPPQRRTLRSVGAVLAGALAGIFLSLGTDLLMHAIGFFLPLGQPMASGPLLVATVYRTIYGVIGSYIAARL